CARVYRSRRKRLSVSRSTPSQQCCLRFDYRPPSRADSRSVITLQRRCLCTRRFFLFFYVFSGSANMAWVCTSSSSSSSDDSGDESANLPAVNVKPEPVACKSEPSSESDSSSDSDSSSSSDGHPFTRSRSRFGGRPRTLFTRERSPLRSDRRPSPNRRGRRPVKIEQNGSLPRADPHNTPSTSNSHTATGRESPYRDIDYQDLSLVVPEATLTADGLLITYALGYSIIPHADVQRRVIFTGPNSLAAHLPDCDEWINVPNGIKMDLDYRPPKITIVPYHLRNSLLPIAPTPPGTVADDGVPRGCPPAIPIVPAAPPAIPIVPTAPPAIPIVPAAPPAIPIVRAAPPAIPIVPAAPPAIPIVRAAPPAIPIVPATPPAIPIVPAIPPAVPIGNVPMGIIKSEIISDDEDDADAELPNDASKVADEGIGTELHNDASKVADEDTDWELDSDEDIDAFKDIDTDILEAQVNLILQRMESENKPVVKRSESNEEPLEEKNIPRVMTSSEHFQKEICQKDSCDPTFGDGFEIDKIMNPKLRNDGVFLFEVQWRHENFAGTDLLEAPIIYDHWPDVALEFYHERYGPNNERLKEITDCY
ncbi:acidic repeat-containing protein-like, partial [Aphis craccivora]